jgi:hypothetical protein
MDSMEHLRQTLEYYRQQRQKKFEDYRLADSLVRQLERELGEAPSSEGEPTIAVNGSMEPAPQISTSRLPEVRPDEFYSMSQSDAAKTYLRKIKRAISFDQLVEALRNGGAQLGGADPKRTLYVSLARNPMKEFVYPKDGFIGLREFYPGLAKVTVAREPKKSKKSKRAKPRRAAHKSKKVVTVVKVATKSPVLEKVHKIMSDGRPRSSDELVKAVEAELGTIKKIEVFGALRNKKFVKEEDGKYRVTK